MKFSKYIAIAIFSCLFISWHPYKLNLDKDEDNLKGPVKTVIETIRNWGDKNIVVKNYNRRGKLAKVKFYGLSTFNDSIIAGSFPDSIKNLTDTNKLLLLYSNIYKYSDSERLIEYYRTNETEKKVVSHSKLFYDTNDSLISIIDYDFNEKEITVDSIKIDFLKTASKLTKTVVKNSTDTLLVKSFFYNNQGKIVSILTKDNHYSDCTKKETIIYDEYGRIAQKVKTGQPKYDFIDCDYELNSFTYDENNRLNKTEHIRKSKYDTTRYEVIFSYDSLGNITQEINYKYDNNSPDYFSKTIFNQNGDYTDWYAVEYFVDEGIQLDIPVKENCLYTYDSHGNWITVQRYREGKLHSKDERIIEYY